MTRRICLLVLLAALAASASPAQDAALPTILVSRQLSERHELSVGDVVELSRDESRDGGRPFRIVGVYEPTPDPMRLGTATLAVRMHLPDLLDLTREAGTPAGTEWIEGVNVALVDPDEAETFAEDVNTRMVGVYAVPAEGASGGGRTFVVLERFHMAIAAVTIIAATVFLLALTIMLVDERRATVGVLRLMGFPAHRILVQVLIEGVLIAGAGALFGLVLAVASEDLINRFFQWRYDTALVFVHITPAVAMTCLAIAVPLGAVATVAASWALLRRNALRLARR